MNAAVELTVGEQLAAARKNLAMSEKDVANKLNLPLERITEIESGEFSKSISMIFYKGYVRSYCQLVNLSPESLVEQWVPEENVITPSQRIREYTISRKEFNTSSVSFKWLTALVVTTIVVIGLWEFKGPITNFVKSIGSDTTMVSEQQTNAVQLSIADAEQSQQQGNNDLVQVDRQVEQPPKLQKGSTQQDITDNSQSSVAGETSTSAQPSVSAQPLTTDDLGLAANQLDLESLTFVFAGDCWVEVIDSTGEQLAVGIKKAGREMSIKGSAPISITLGDPSVVALSHNDVQVDLSNYRAGRTAKFIIE
jgi:cytoskeleton protein RodZ